MHDASDPRRRIEDIYKRLRKAGGLVAQGKLGLQARDLAAGFAETVSVLSEADGSGAFYPDRETSLRDLAERDPPSNRSSPYDTEDLQSLMGLPRWRVVDSDFESSLHGLLSVVTANGGRLDGDVSGNLERSVVSAGLRLVSAHALPCSSREVY